MSSKYCTCQFGLSTDNERGERVCDYCGKPFGMRAIVDRDLLLQMARLCGEIRMVELMGMFTIDEARAFRERCEQILREHGDQTE